MGFSKGCVQVLLSVMNKIFGGSYGVIIIIILLGFMCMLLDAQKIFKKY